MYMSVQFVVPYLDRVNVLNDALYSGSHVPPSIYASNTQTLSQNILELVCKPRTLRWKMRQNGFKIANKITRLYPLRDTILFSLNVCVHLQ